MSTVVSCRLHGPRAGPGTTPLLLQGDASIGGRGNPLQQRISAIACRAVLCGRLA